MSKKTFLAILIGILLIGGGVYFFSSTASEYEVMVLDEISELEAELASLDAQVAAGTLSPAAATVARANIISKLNTINTQMEAGGKASLSAEQKAQLSEGLTRLKRVLVRYSATLDTVDAVAAKDTRTVRSSRSLNSHFVTTVESSEQAVVAAEVTTEADAATEAALDEVEETLLETIEDVVEEVETEVMVEAETETTSSTDAEADADTTTESEEPTTDEPVLEIETQATTTVE